MAGEKEVGKITHYFGNIGVAVIEITKDGLQIGDKIHVKGEKTDFEQEVISLQIDRKSVEKVGVGDDVGMKLNQPAKKGDLVYLVAK